MQYDYGRSKGRSQEKQMSVGPPQNAKHGGGSGGGASIGVTEDFPNKKLEMDCMYQVPVVFVKTLSAACHALSLSLWGTESARMRERESIIILVNN